MRIKVFTTNQVNKKYWESYLKSFNNTFNKEYEIEDIQKNFILNPYGYSFHSFLISDEDEVVGSISVVPQKYMKEKDIIHIGLAVGVFISKDHRVDMYSLRNMYKELKPILVSQNIVAIIAIPNLVVYNYWKGVVKWRDIGDLDYWVLPLRLGNIINKFKITNSISFAICRLVLSISYILVLIKNDNHLIAKYRQFQDEKFYYQRFSGGYNITEIKNMRFVFDICNEQGTRVAYLFDSREDGIFTAKSLYIAVKYIVKNVSVDMICYIGMIRMMQFSLLKVPHSKEPRRLRLMCDILEKGDSSLLKDIYDISSWDFGLMNFDVR